MKNIYSIIFLLLNFGFYVEESVSVIWPCTNSIECSIVDTASCSPSGNCRCPAGFVFSTDVTKCIPEISYGESCQEGVQCSHMLTGADCRGGVCTCAEGFTYLRGRCRQLKPIGSSCLEDIECEFSYDREAVICKNNKCECSDKYYSRTENICRRKSMRINETCIVNDDCAVSNLICDKDTLKCATRSVSVQTEKYITFEIKPKKTSESTQVDIILNSSNPNNDDKKKFGEECTNNGNVCAGLSHSICRDGLCYCQDGYYENSGNCNAELGELADRKELCEDDPKIFEYRNGKCLCVHNRFYSPNLRDCKKPVAVINESCTQNSQCSPFGESFCSTITPKTCRCYEYAKYDETTELCVKKDGLGGYCKTVCAEENTKCNNKNICVCKENYVEQNGACKAGVNTNCTETDECGIENSECIEKKCQCQNGYVYIMEKCLQQASNYEDECIEKEQCKPLLGDLSECVEKKCVCNETTQFNDGKCFEKKNIGESCARSSECFIENDKEKIECRNTVCNCKLEYTPDVEKQQCVKPTSKSSNGPSPFKIITLLLITSAILITGAALKEAYYDR